ncbi:MAG TPA: cytochrome c3 family protein, partial [Smithellaceae bacterium]|nr:cytochrome c3 family protein [Smithellaceae bacterium]
MSKILFRTIFMLAALWVAWIPTQAGAQAQTLKCQTCHSDSAFVDLFAASVHGNNACTSCHTGIDDIARHSSGDKKSNPVQCSACHKEIAASFKKDVHAMVQNMTCVDCHQKIHTITKSEKPEKIAVQERCVRCHNPEDFALMGHGKAVAAGNADSATCSDCHSLHAMTSYDATFGKEKAIQREAYTLRCKSCHADQGITDRNDLSTAVADTYDQTYHGKVL